MKNLIEKIKDKYQDRHCIRDCKNCTEDNCCVYVMLNELESLYEAKLKAIDDEIERWKRKPENRKLTVLEREYHFGRMREANYIKLILEGNKDE